MSPGYTSRFFWIGWQGIDKMSQWLNNQNTNDWRVVRYIFSRRGVFALCSTWHTFFVFDKYFNPKTPGLTIHMYISPGRVSCLLPQMHPDPICIFYLIPSGVVTCMPYSGSAGWGGGGNWFSQGSLALTHRSSQRSAGKC
jgi:hypothetical protein